MTMSITTGATSLLLVADAVEMCDRIASASLSAPGFYRIERVTSSEFVNGSPTNGIQLALVDQNLQAAKPAAVVQRLAGAGIPSVVMVDSREVATLQEVVLAGAAALIATPFADTQLWETVSTAMAKGAPVVPHMVRPADNGTKRHGMVVAVVSPKPGCGASVLSVNLGVALKEKPASVALLEAGEGSFSHGLLLNLKPERTLGDLLSCPDPADHELLEGALARHTSGVRALLAPPGPGVRIPADMLEDIVHALRATYDYVIVDLSGSGSGNLSHLVEQADATLAVVIPEMTSLQHGRVFLETILLNTPEIRPNLVLNRSGMAGAVPSDAIRRHLKLDIAAELPDDQALVTASVNRGIPFVSSHPRSALVKAVRKLAADLTPAVDPTPVTAKAAGLVKPAGLRSLWAGKTG